MHKEKPIKKICITGGHLAPAIAVIEEIQTEKKSWEVVFVGRAKTSYINTKQSEEKTQIEKMHIPFFTIHAGRISRIFSFRSVIELLYIPVGFIESFVFCLRERPDCVVSFGGYIGIPMIIAAWLLDIKTVIHEQTHTLGLANRIALEFANKILLTFPDRKMQKDNRVMVTGLPIRRSFIHPPKTCSLPVPGKKPILYITGGTTGAVSMNNLLFPIIAALAKRFEIIHQTGQSSYEHAVDVKTRLPADTTASYIPKSYIDSEDVSWIMHHARLIIGRSGANTVMEVAMIQQSALFIPLPWAGHQEQLRNATWYASVGGDVTIVDQQKTSSEKLEKIIFSMLQSSAHKNGILQDEKISAASTAVVEAIASLA